VRVTPSTPLLLDDIHFDGLMRNGQQNSPSLRNKRQKRKEPSSLSGLKLFAAVHSKNKNSREESLSQG
jgi:hypothetical protein